MHFVLGQSPQQLRQLASSWGRLILACGLLLILFTTLFPFEFFPIKVQDVSKNVDLRILRPGAIVDYIRNVLLFVPVGFGVSALMKQRGSSFRVTLALVMVTGLLLTLIVEIAQLFLPDRSSSLADALSNVFGAFLGFLLFTVWGNPILSFATKALKKTGGYLDARRLAIITVAYALLALVISTSLLRIVSFSNWDESFTLILGNEHTGDRPWEGKITELWIADRALDERSIARMLSSKDRPGIDAPWLAHYSLAGGAEYADKIGNLPDLVWRGAAPEDVRAPIAAFDSGRWLETEAPATSLIQRLKQSSQITLVSSIATADLEQVGPARIISISSDAFQRDFTLGQEGEDLTIRLRTPATGANGTRPEFAVPGFFKDRNQRQIVITYKDSVLSLHVDGMDEEHVFELNPEVTGLSSLILSGRWILRPQKGLFTAYMITYQAFIFIPLTFLLALIATHLKWSFLRTLLLFGSGLLLYALILEASNSLPGTSLIRVHVILLDLLVALGTFLIFRIRA